MNRETLVTWLRECDALAIAAGLEADRDVTWSRDGAPDAWFVEDVIEESVEAHRAAHADGRPSEAIVTYGEGVAPETVAQRLLDLAHLAAETGLLRTVCPVPVDGVDTPGSWGVEDLTIIAASRRVLDPAVRIRPSWQRLGAQTCAVALAFGADDLAVPEGDRTDPEVLVASVGRRAVER